MLATLLSTALAGSPGLPVITHALERPDHLRLVVIGDTGVVPAEQASPCGAVGTSCKLSQSDTTALWARVEDEDADAVFIPGDLVYGPSFFESAPRCRNPDRVRGDWHDPALGDKVRHLGVPVYLALGNHDVAHRQRSRARERCILAYAATEPALELPDLNYVVDFGLARLVVHNTNVSPDRWSAPDLHPLTTPAGWTLMGGHHVVRTRFDKEDEHAIRDWLVTHDLRPDVWLNGHAHFLQFGVYDGIPAVTSGAGAKVRVRPSCPGEQCDGDDAPQFSASTFGYAVLDVTPHRLQMTFKSAAGAPLFCWQRTPDDPEGGPCEDPTTAADAQSTDTTSSVHE